MRQPPRTWIVAALALAPLLLAASLAGCASAPAPDRTCLNCPALNVPHEPFHIAGNSWYVGTDGLSVVLITGPEGHILLDGGVPESVPLIERNIRALGFRVEDIRLIVTSHVHYDHAGGVPELQAHSGARVAASPWSAQALRKGSLGFDDPQYIFGESARIPTVRQVQEVKDGETLHVGSLAITAHFTPGHSPGGTTWSWPNCEAGTCLDMVFADSLNPVSVRTYRFRGEHARILRESIAKVAALKCDVIIPDHPIMADIFGKLARRTPDNNTLIDPQGCRRYAALSSLAVDARLKREESGEFEDIPDAPQMTSGVGATVADGGVFR